MKRRPLLAALALFGAAAAGCSKPTPVPNTANDTPIAATHDTAKPAAATPAAAGDAGDRAKSVANLKQILLAEHNYHDAYNRFPWNVVSAAKPPVALLSWRVRILPYLEQDALYKKFKLDEPWDSEHNKALIKEMPAVYAPVRGKAAAGETFCQVFVGKGALWESAVSADARSIRDFVDGSSNTFAVVEAGTPVVWTKPDDIPFDPAGPLPKLGGKYADGFHAVMFDGVGYFVPRDVDPAAVKATVTIAGNDNTRAHAEVFRALNVDVPKPNPPSNTTPPPSPKDVPPPRPTPSTKVTFPVLPTYPSQPRTVPTRP